MENIVPSPDKCPVTFDIPKNLQKGVKLSCAIVD